MKLIEKNIYKRKNLLLIILCLCTQSSFSQSPPHWRYFTSENGLAESWVECVTVGPSGKVWISHGVAESISVYDGYYIQQYPSPGPKLKVVESVSQEYWAALTASKLTSLTGFQRFFQNAWIHFPFDNPNSNNAEFEFVHSSAFLPFDINRILFLTKTHLMNYDIESRHVKTLKKHNETQLLEFTALTESRDGSIWITGKGGIAKLSKAGKNFSSLKWEEWITPKDKKCEDFNLPFEGDNGEFFCSASFPEIEKRILVRYHDESWDIPAISYGEDVAAGWRGHDDGIWLKSKSLYTGDLLHVFSNCIDVVEKNKILSGYFFDITPQTDGVFWLGTSQGLARYAPPIWRTPPELRDIKSYFYSMCEDSQKRLWFSSLSHLVLYQNKKWKLYPITEEFTIYGPFVQTVHPLPDNRVVVAVKDIQLLLFDCSKEQFEFLPHPKGKWIIRQSPRNDRSLWLITGYPNEYKSLETFDGSKFHTVLEKLLFDIGEIRVVFESEDGSIWFGGNNGIARYINESFQTYGTSDGYMGKGGFCFLDRGNGSIWVGGRDHIYEFDGQNWTMIRSSGLETVRSMIESHDGVIWIASGSGVHRFYDGTWLSNSRDDGLPDAAVIKIFEDHGNRIWAGTTQGLSQYHSGADRDAPETLIGPEKNSLQIPPNGEAHFMFEGLDKWKYTARERLLYSYKFDEQQWSPFTSDTVLSATGLKHGNHSFEVRAMDRNWNVDPTPAVFQFTVLFPWYKEPLFIVFFIISVLLITISLFYAIHRHLCLHRLVEERTSNLQKEIKTREKLERQFIQAQKMEAVGQLAGGVAHDFNNILMAISGNSQFILKRKDIDKELRDDVEEIQKSAARAATLTRQLLAFSRKQILEPKIINLNDLVENMSKMLRRLIGEDVQLNFIPAPHINPIEIDPGQMEQVIMNLAVNARDAMLQGGVLTIETNNVFLDEDYAASHDQAHAGPHVMLAVSDTGHGMNKETQQKIFDPFYTTKEQGKGTGLGLSTVYGIVKQCGGNIWVYSEPGKGTTFRIYYPSVEQRDQAASLDFKSVSFRHGQETILIVEDDEMVRKLSSRSLKEFGYTVLEARNGLKALELCKEHDGQIDLVLTDVIMPEMGGPELIAQLAETYPKIKVVYMSGYTDNAISHHGILEEGIAFLNKPASPDEIGQKVREVLDT